MGPAIFVLGEEERLLGAFVFGGGFLQSVQQGFCAGWNWDLMFEDDVAGTDLLAVEFIVAAVIGAESGAFERDAGEEAARARVGKNFGAQGDIGFGGGCAANWAGGGADVTTELDLAAEHAAG